MARYQSIGTTQSTSFLDKTKQFAGAVFDAPAKLGQDIAQLMTNDFQEAREAEQRYEQSKNNVRQIANKLLPNDPRRIQLERIINDDSVKKTIDELPNRNGRQMLADLVQTALFMAPVPAFKALKGLSLGAKMLKGSLQGTVIGATGGLTESFRGKDVSLAKSAKETALGAVGGAILGGILPPVITGAGKGLSGIAKAGQFAEKQLEKIPIYRNIILPLQTRLEQFYGDEGKQIVQKLVNANDKAIQKTAFYTQKLDDAGFYKFTPEEKINFVKLAEGRETQAISKRVNDSLEVYKEIRDVIGQEAVEKGVKIKVRSGQEVPFAMRENYYPHDMLRPEIFANKNFRAGALQNAVDFGYFDNVDEAGKALDGWLEASAKEGMTSKENAFVNYLARKKFTPQELETINTMRSATATERKIMQMGEEEYKLTTEIDSLKNIVSSSPLKNLSKHESKQLPGTLSEMTQLYGDKWAEKAGISIQEKSINEVANEYEKFAKSINQLKALKEKLKNLQDSVKKTGVKEKDLLKSFQEAKTEAAGMVTRFWKKSTMPKSGHLEKAREFDFPFYDSDPQRVVTKWLNSSTDRLATIEEFGLKNQELTKLIGKIKQKQGSVTAKEASNLIKVATGAIEHAPVTEKASMFMRAISVPKLAFTPIQNLTQNLNTLLATDTPSFFKGIISVFTKEGRKRALKSGATLQQVISEMSKGAGAEYDFANNFLKYNGFQLTEKINRTVAANAGMAYTERNFKTLLKNPMNKVARARLQELGINTDLVLARGELIEEELLKAGRKLSDMTQYNMNAMNLPAWASSDMGKVVAQFKTFAYNQTRFLKNQLVKELNSNNPARVARLFLILGTIFPMGGEVARDLRSLITQEKRPTDALDRYLQDIVSVGGLGILTDLYSSATYGRLAETFLGPTMGSLTQSTEALIQTMQRYMEVGDLSSAFTPGRTRQILSPAGPAVTYPLKYFYPSENQPDDQESTIESIQNLIDEIRWKQDTNQPLNLPKGRGRYQSITQ